MKLKPEVRTQPKSTPKGTGRAVNFSRMLTAKERVQQAKPVAQMTPAEKDQLLEDLRAALLE